MVREIFIEFWGSRSDQWQIVPWAGWEVVMFDVVSQVQVEKVPKSQIIVCFHSCNKLVVFGNDVNCCWMSSNWKESSSQNESEGATSKELINQEISAYDQQKISGFTNCHFLMHVNEGSESIDEGLESEKNELGKFTSEDIDFKLCGKIGISFILSKVIMVVWMVNSETYCWWNTDCNVAENSKSFINENVWMSWQMSKVMD